MFLGEVPPWGRHPTAPAHGGTGAWARNPAEASDSNDLVVLKGTTQ